MVANTDFEKFLLEKNFVGGAEQDPLPNYLSDSRTHLSTDANDNYVVDYYFLTSFNDFLNLGYYDTLGNDIGNDNKYDDPYKYPDNGSSALSDPDQLGAINRVLSSSAYGASFSDVATIVFSASASQDANIVFGAVNSSTLSHGFAYKYIEKAQAELRYGDVWLNQNSTDYLLSSDPGSYGYWLVTHEIAHSLGLDHTNPTVEQSNPVPVYADYDNHKYSVMSYNKYPDSDPVGSDNEVAPFGLQLLDIAAVQEIYGRNWSTRNGDNTEYSKLTAFASTRLNEAFIYTIWDGGGTGDTISADGYYETGIGANALSGAKIDLRQGEFSSIGLDAYGNDAVDNVAIAYHTIIENAIGSKLDDILIGNAWNNRLEGGDGNDTLYGDGLVYNSNEGFGANDGNHETESGVAASANGSGYDKLYGGAGDDTLIGGYGYDDLYGGDGDDVADYSKSTNGITGYFGDEILYNVVYDGLFFEGFQGDDYLYSVEKVIGSSNDDQFYIYSNYFTGIEIDGGGGTDTVTYSQDITYDARHGNNEIWAGVGKAVLNNVENVNVSTFAKINLLLNHSVNFSQSWLANADPILTANSVVLDYSSATSGLTFDFYSGGNNQISVTGGGLSHTISSDVEAIRGSQYGDVFNTHFITRAKEIYTGAGDDVVNMAAASYVDYELHYSGGNDVFNLTEQIKTIYLADTIQMSDITIGSLSSTGAGQFSVDLTIAGHGVLALNFDDYALHVIKISLEAGGSISIQNHYGANGFTGWEITQSGYSSTLYSYDGTWGADEWVGRQGVSETYRGYGGADILNGMDGNDLLYGGDGNDIIAGGVGSDAIFGGDGNDTAKFAGRYENYSITQGDITWEVEDTVATEGTDILDGVERLEFSNGTYDVATQVFASNLTSMSGTSVSETIHGSSSNDEIIALAGDDVIYGEDGNDVMYGGDGNDTFWGGSGVNTYFGEAGDDYIYSSAGDYSYGGAGNDTIRAYGGVSYFDGGDGNDRVWWRDYIHAGSIGMTVDLAAGTAIDGDGNISTLVGIEYLTGSSYADTLKGDDNVNVIRGGADYNSLIDGDDVIYGYGGDDELHGDSGNDLIYGGDGNDYIQGNDGADTLYGEDGDDSLAGYAGDDTFYGGVGSDTIYGGDGNDIIDGGTGNDQLDGDNGNDTIYGGDGTDGIHGWNDDDIIYGGNDRDYIYGDDGDDTLNGDDGNDYIYGGNDNDTLYGGAGNDRVDGDTGNDTLYGGAGSDYIFGDGGNDFLHGGDDRDYLYGGDGDDTLIFGEGVNSLYGQGGTDTFKAEEVASFDHDMSYASDFDESEDILDLTDLLSGYNAGTDSLSDFVNIQQGSNTTIQVDRDGTGTTYSWDNVIRLQGNTTISTDADQLVSNGTLLVA